MKILLYGIRCVVLRMKSSVYGFYLKAFFKKIGKHVYIHNKIDFCDPIKIVISDNCVIRSNVTLKGRSNEDIGIFVAKGVSIREYAYLDCYMGVIYIDEYAALGHNVL